MNMYKYLKLRFDHVKLGLLICQMVRNFRVLFVGLYEIAVVYNREFNLAPCL